MKKSTVILISLTAIILFAGLVYYGLSHSRGVPVKLEKPKKVILEVQFLDEEIDLSKNAGLDIWQALPKKEIELMRQVTVLPWGKSLLSPVIVSAFHNKKDIYFYMSWKDDTRDSDAGIKAFSDASAVMFPIGDDIPSHTIMMGFMNKANIWHWKASRDKQYWMSQEKARDASELQEKKVYADYYYPFEEKEHFVVSKDIPQSAVNDLIAIRVGTITAKELQNVQGRGFWSVALPIGMQTTASRPDGRWQVVFKRPIAISDPEVDANLEPAAKNVSCAFAVWNGANGDRGGRKSISDWVELDIR